MNGNQSTIVLMSMAGCISVVVMAILALVIVLVVRNQSGSSGGGIGGGGGGSVGSGTSIPIGTYPFPRGKDPWYADSSGHSAISATNSTLRIQLKKNSTGGSSGGGFKANPFKTFPTTGVEFGYRVYFPEDFEWKKGGKLPGVCWGKNSGDCATGSKWSTTAGSFRVMWRESGQAIGYAYLAVVGSGASAGNRAMEQDQGPGFTKSVRLNSSNKSGLDIWHKDGTPLQFNKGWNTVWMRLRMNTPGSANGELTLDVNGQKNTVTDAVLRLDESVRFTSLNIVAFRGGHGADWEGDRDTSLEFRDFTLRSVS
jgi:hypothetical protein